VSPHPNQAVEALDPLEAAKLARLHHSLDGKPDPVRDIQVLCPMNRGGLGARSLNI
jgi:exodeoxyribonuclease V alpha subunit